MVSQGAGGAWLTNPFLLLFLLLRLTGRHLEAGDLR